MCVTRHQNDAINLRLALLGLPLPVGAGDSEAAQLAQPILARQRELSRRLADRLCAADGRIQAFLDDYLADTGELPKLPRRTFVLDEPGMARELSLPFDGDTFTSPLLTSYRLVNGVLHNPANDRRTTAGVFHIAEGGLPIPDDKIAVPKVAFARLLARAFEPPHVDMVLPYTANQPEPAACFVSLQLRPLVAPQVPGSVQEKRMETRFIVPGGLVSNLDFVEGIFGNGGDPYLPENDASLAPETWTGHTGCVILAPHLTRVTKKELGLPHVDDATDRQKRDGVCWADEDERYNNGQAFKICARDARGVIVTVIADNYFGYCKKEVKTQISYSANLFGNAEEEHAGGALVFPSYNLGQEYTENQCRDSYTLAQVLDRDPQRFAAQPEGHALDLQQPHIVLVPGGARYSMRDMTVSWPGEDGQRASIPMRADTCYLSPNGYRVQMHQQPFDPTVWNLTGTVAEPTSCHKPATVSGGGKSEISKAITDAFIYGSAYVADFDDDMDRVAAILERDYSQRFLDPARNGVDHRRILAEDRSIGSVIKLLTPSPAMYTAEHNAWLERIPVHVKELVYVIKRAYRPEWGDDWRSHFSVVIINGRQGNSLRLDGSKITVNMLRVGFNTDGSWRLFGLRHDFSPATKVQTQDDITASTVVPGSIIGLDPSRSYRLVENCENLLFQRPDDAIHRGYDKQAERDIASPGTFLSNWQPLTRADAVAMRDDAVAFSAFSAPMAGMISAFADSPEDQGPTYFVSSANPRIVDGKPTKNPRYLQPRPDRANAPATAVGRALVPAGPPPALRRTADPAGGRRRRRTSQQPAGRPGPSPVLVQPAALHGAARAVHGVHLLDDRQVPVHDGRRVRGGADQGPVQRDAGGRRPELLAAGLHPHRLRRLAVRSRLRRAEGARGPRHLHAHPRDLLPDEPAGAGREEPHRRGRPGEAGRLRARGHRGRGQPAGLPDHRDLRHRVLRPDLPAPAHGAHPGDAASRAAGRRGIRPVGGHDRGHPRAGRPVLLRRRDRLPGHPAAAGAAGDHGPRRHRAGVEPGHAGVPGDVHARVRPGLGLVRSPAGRQAGRGPRSS